MALVRRWEGGGEHNGHASVVDIRKAANWCTPAITREGREGEGRHRKQGRVHKSKGMQVKVTDNGEHTRRQVSKCK